MSSMCLHLAIPWPGGDLPDKPQRSVKRQQVQFDGVVQERHTTARGSEYVRITFGEKGGDPVKVLDAEFLFLEGMVDEMERLEHSAHAHPS